MLGGADSDLYVVDNAGDVVVEAPDAGYDSINSTISLYLHGNVEGLYLQAGAGDLFGVGNELANAIAGNEGANLLIGWGGDDSMTGGTGNDILFGVDGADTMLGEDGVDYLAAGSGDDLVFGGNGSDEIWGEEGDDQLSGGDSFEFDILVGGDGNDTLFGDSTQGDYDYLYGNLGDDTFYVDTPADLEFEQPGEGIDTVYANIAGAGFYLHGNVENLTLLGTTPFGVGNELANTLIGNDSDNYLLGGAGNDTLNGKGGGDVLFGEGGADLFVFEAGTGGDVIGDFVSGEDRIDLSALGLSFAELQATFVQDGNIGAILLGHGDLVVLHNVTMSELAAIDFIFG
jgi:Ca2+-binding RTX toxin-like protein